MNHRRASLLTAVPLAFTAAALAAPAASADVPVTTWIGRGETLATTAPAVYFNAYYGVEQTYFQPDPFLHGETDDGNCRVTSPSGAGATDGPDDPLVNDDVCYATSDTTGDLHFTNYERVFTPRSDADIGHWVVECSLEATFAHLWNIYCAPYAGLPCDLSCATSDSDTFVVQTWQIDVLPPAVTISGALRVERGQPIVLDVTPADPHLTYSWDVSSPALGYTQPDVERGTHFELTADAPGTWRIAVTAQVTGGNGRGISSYVDVEVVDTPPAVTLTGPSLVRAGDTIVIEDTVTHAADGRELAFQWNLLQAPNGGLPLDPSLPLDEPSIEVPTDAASAGTWSFQLQACNGGACTDSSRFDVVVDGLPTASIAPVPSEVGPFDFPLTLNGHGSVDPDSWCPPDGPVGCNHWVADGWDLAGISPGLTYRWFVDSVPTESDARPGPVADAFLVPDDGPELGLEFEDLVPGPYTFRLHVTDGEGNSDDASVSFTVHPLDIAPIALVSPPHRYLTDVDGVLEDDIVVDGSQSYDVDFSPGAPPPSPGGGIASYAWTVEKPSLACLDSASRSEPTFEPFAAGDVVPPACLGTWNLTLTVTDETGHESSAHTAFIIGNCEGAVCIDFPTEDEPAEVGIGSDVDVTVFYHVDSTVYEESPYGFISRLDILPAGDETPVFEEDDAPSDSSPGDLLTFNWNGSTTGGDVAPTGDYDVRIRLLDAWSGDPIAGYEETEHDAIHWESPIVAIDDTSDRYVCRGALERGTDQADFHAVLTEADGVDTWRWTVRNASGAVVRSLLVDSADDELTASWDGRSGTVLQPPGDYELEVAAFRDGRLLASSTATITVYDVRLVATGSGATHARVRENDDDDDGNGRSDLLDDSAVDGEDDLVQVTATIEPASFSGSTRLVPASGVALYQDAEKASPCGAACEAEVAAGDSTVATAWVEGVVPGSSSVDFQFISDDGGPFDPVTLPVDVVALHILGPDGARADSVRVGMWDGAYAADGSVLNDLDPAQNFIDLDRNHFSVELIDPASNLDPSARDVVTALIGTVHVSPHNASFFHDDDDTPIPLIETSETSGVFVSQTQLLTSNDDPTLIRLNPDDEQPTIAVDGSAVLDEAPYDRTHRVGSAVDGYLEGGVRVTAFGPAGDMTTAEVPVCGRAPGQRWQVPVQVVVWNEPHQDVGYFDATDTWHPSFTDGFDFQDLNGDGVHEPGEPSEPYLDLSDDPSGTWVHGDDAIPPASGWGPVADDAEVMKEIEKANLAWAPACVELVLDGPIAHVDPPRRDEPGLFFSGGPYDDVPDLLASSAVGTRVDILYLVVPGPNIGAFDGTAPDGTAEYGPLAGETFGPMLGYEVTAVVLASGLDLDDRTLAHELGHALTNTNDVPTDPWFFFPSTFTTDELSDDLIDENRRFTGEALAQALTERPLGILHFSDPGNRLRHPF